MGLLCLFVATMKLNKADGQWSATLLWRQCFTYQRTGWVAVLAWNNKCNSRLPGAFSLSLSLSLSLKFRFINTAKTDKNLIVTTVDGWFHSPPRYYPHIDRYCCHCAWNPRSRISRACWWGFFITSIFKLISRYIVIPSILSTFQNSNFPPGGSGHRSSSQIQSLPSWLLSVPENIPQRRWVV